MQETCKKTAVVRMGASAGITCLISENIVLARASLCGGAERWDSRKSSSPM